MEIPVGEPGANCMFITSHTHSVDLAEFFFVEKVYRNFSMLQNSFLWFTNIIIANS